MENDKVTVTFNFHYCVCKACCCASTSYRFTPREQEVAELLATGKRQRDIAQQLVITQRTVRHHEQSILQKLGVETRFEAGIKLHDLLFRKEHVA